MNGVAVVKDNKVNFYNKGLEYTNEDAVNDYYKNDGDWLIYHTRIKSAGSIKDSNCHPYISKKNKEINFVLAMNGTISNFSSLGEAIDMTDTEIFFRNMVMFNADLKLLEKISCRFIGFKDGKVYASNNTTFNGLKFIDKDGAIIISSSFPKDFPKSIEYKTMSEGLWIEGENIKEYKPVVYNRSSYYGGIEDCETYDEYLNRIYGVPRKELNQKKDNVTIITRTEQKPKDSDEELFELVLDAIKLDKNKVIDKAVSPNIVYIEVDGGSFYVELLEDGTASVGVFDKNGYVLEIYEVAL